MTNDEFERLDKAHQLHYDMTLLQDAIVILRKQSKQLFNRCRDKGEIVRTAMSQFLKDEDIALLLSKKLEILEREFAKL